MSVKKPTLLFVTPVIPEPTGAGINMRAEAHVEALLELFDVTLAIINGGLNEAETLAQIPPYIRRACSAIHIVNQPCLYDKLAKKISGLQGRILLEAIWPTPVLFTRNIPALAQLATKLTRRHFDIVHCFRLHTSKLVPFLRKHGITYSRSVLDIDDYESAAARRLAKQTSDRMGRQHTALAFLEAAKLAAIEACLIPRFTDGYVCSDSDKRALEKRFPKTRWTIMPNVLPHPKPMETVPRDIFTFIFVGKLSYAPNKDGVIFFCKSILPILRSLTSIPFRILVAGRTPDSELIDLARKAQVEVVANPLSVAPFYAKADAAIVPLRTGGGTRIKILEAFSYSLPVVSTTIGAEGLGVISGVHALIADSPREFAERCYQLMSDSTLRKTVSAAGHDLFQKHFSADILVHKFKTALCATPSLSI